MYIFLAKQMGTSVQMIEAHYGHVNPVKNAESILQGLPGWEPIVADAQVCAASDGVNTDTAKPKRGKVHWQTGRDHIGNCRYSRRDSMRRQIRYDSNLGHY